MKIIYDNFEDWWESEGSNFKNETGGNIYDTELPLRVAEATWDAAAHAVENHIFIKPTKKYGVNHENMA